jgi:hypothetical protein
MESYTIHIEFARSKHQHGRHPPDDLNAARSRHLGHLCAAAELIKNAGENRVQRVITRLLDEYAEIMAALEWALSNAAAGSDAEEDVRLLLAAQRRGNAARGLSRAAVLPASAAADLTLLASHLYFRTGDLSAAKPLLEQYGAAM